MGVSPMKRLWNKSPEIPGSADENVGLSRAGRPCPLQALPTFAGHIPSSNDNLTIRRTMRSS